MKTAARVLLVGVIVLAVLCVYWWLAAPPSGVPAGTLATQPAVSRSAAARISANPVSSSTAAAADRHGLEPRASLRSANRSGDRTRASRQPHSNSHAATGAHSVGPAAALASVPPLDNTVFVRPWVEQRLRLYFQAVEVDAPTRERLIQLLVDYYEESIEARQVGREQGLSSDDILQLGLERYRRRLADAQAILGQEAGRHFISSYNAASVIPIAEDFAARCAAAGVPITPALTNRIAINLTDTLVPPELLPRLPRNPDGTIGFDLIAVRRATPVLNATQLALFKQLLAERPYPRPGG